jgi:hypothetical protein
LKNEKQIGLFAAFLAENVEFAVVGGVAVNVHGYVRATRDLDVFIRPTELNAQAAFRALQNIGAPVDGLEANDLLDDKRHFRFGSPEDHIDILASIGDMSFDEVWVDRVEVEAAGLRVPFISKAKLMENKRQTGRLRDLVDVEELELLQDEEDRGGFG